MRCNNVGYCSEGFQALFCVHHAVSVLEPGSQGCTNPVHRVSCATRKAEKVKRTLLQNTVRYNG